ncbi:MAG: alpha/beta hydrolase [Alphaproteobacteria bacterium]|nr:alpha/beta hydrolase [Alphaproteobacteria bacterium]
MTLQFIHRYADVNGVRLHYAEAGRGALMLFVHGFPEFWYMWRHQLADFGRDRRAVAYDQRGYNLSSRPEGVAAYRTKHLVADLVALIRHLGHGRATVVGHDWGGVVAWAAAIAHPEVVERLVIINAPHPAVYARLLRDDPAQQRASGYIVKYRTAGAEDWLAEDDLRRMRESITEPGLAQGYFDQADAEAYLESWRQPGALTAMLNYYRAMQMAPPHKDGTPGEIPALDPDRFVVRVPTLVIWGLRDRFLLPQNLDGLDAFVPDLRVHRIPDATHWVVHEQGEQVGGAIRAFLDSAA